MLDDYDFRKVCNELSDGLLVLQDGFPVYVNHFLAALIGCPAPHVLMAQTDSFLAMDLDPDVRRAVYAAADRRVVKAESRLRRQKGAWIDVEVTGRPLQLDYGFGELLVIRETAGRKRIEKELLKARQLASIAALSGGIAHDYNNLLTAIMGNISLCLAGLESTTPQHDWLSQAQDAALIAKELTNRLITFSKGGSPIKETVDPAELVEGATAFALSGSNLEVCYDLPQGLWHIDVDRMQVGQAIHNIVINAREAMPEGGLLTVTACNADVVVPTDSKCPGRYVVISIQDNGKGIASAIMNRIFDPYFTTKAMGEERGLGLGLSIANSIIENHGGGIGVDAAPGKGARFSVYMQASEKVMISTQQEDTCPMETNGLHTGRILVMDDEEMIRNLVGTILTRLGYEPSFACHGDEAIACYRDAMAEGKPFDAVILDLTVKGGLGGKETIKELVAIDPAVRGIVSSGYANDPGVVNYRDYGFCAVVAKPYRIKDICDQLAQVLGGREGQVAMDSHQPKRFPESVVQRAR